MAFGFKLHLKIKRLSVTMSWIDDEADENLAKENAEEDRLNLIARSSYWEKLVRQIDDDVKKINSHVYWQSKLGKALLIFGPATSGSGYRVSKPGFPGVIVSFSNEGEHIIVKRDFYEKDPVSENVEFRGNEPLEVTTSGENVVLRSPYVKNRVFIVPEEASEYILRVVIESLKISKPLE